MPGLSDFLLDPRGQLRNTAARNAYASAAPPRPPGEIPSFSMDGLDIRQAYQPGQRFGNSATANARPFSAIVSHWTGTPNLQGALNTLKGDPSRGGHSFGYHFYIDKDGSVIQGAPLDARTNHVEGYGMKGGHRTSRADINNSNAIGISMVGQGAPTPQQLESGRKLVAGLKDRFKIQDQNIVGHGQIQSNREHDEGTHLLNATRGQPAQTASAQPAPASSGSSPMPAPSGQATRGRGAAISPTMAMGKLQSLGFNEAQSRAIVGNMVQESSLRPGSVTSKEGAYGLMQWRGDRFASLQQFAKGKGTDWRDANTQMEFIAHEMKNNPYEAKQAQRFLQANTVEEANAGMKSYLRYGDNSDAKRLAYSKEIPTSTGGAMAEQIAPPTTGQQAIEQAAPLVPGAQPAPPSAMAYGPTGAAAVPSPTAPPPLSGAGPGPGVTDPRRLSPDNQPRFNSSAAPPSPARTPEPGDIQGRIDQQIEKMYGVPPPAPEPGDIQGRIDAQIEKMYGATAPPATPGPQSYLDGQPQTPAPVAQASPPVSPPVAPAPKAPPARQNAPARQPAAIAPSPLIRMHGTDDGTTMGRLIPGTPQQRTAAAPAPSLKQAIAAAVPLPRPKPDMPGAPPQQGGPLSNMPGVLDQTQPPKVTGRDLDPTPFTQRGDLLGQSAHPSTLGGFAAPDPLAAGIMQPPAATAAAPSLGNDMASAIMNPISPTGPGQTSAQPQNPPTQWPAPGSTAVPYAPAPTYEAFGSQPGPQTFSGGNMNPSALPWWMQQQMPGFTPQNYGAWGDIGGGGWDGFG